MVGPENWHNEFRAWHGNGKKDAQICGIPIYNEQRREWITKWDGAEDTDIEAIKGGLSDSMKRAAVQWGIGRVLYKMDLVWVDIEQRGSSYVIAQKERPKLDKAYLNMLKKLKLEPAQPGGLQSQLMPSGGAGQSGAADTTPRPTAPATQGTEPAQTRPQQTSPAGTRNNSPAPSTGNQGGNITPMPTQRPVCEYKVTGVNVQKGMQGNQITSLKLMGQDNREIKAFYNGTDAALVPGAELASVKLTVSRQDSVVFNILNCYSVIPSKGQAA